MQILVLILSDPTSSKNSVLSLYNSCILWSLLKILDVILVKNSLISITYIIEILYI